MSVRPVGSEKAPGEQRKRVRTLQSKERHKTIEEPREKQRIQPLEALLGELSGPSWALLGSSWAVLAPFWSVLRGFGRLGSLLGVSWALLDASWACLGAVLGRLGAVLGPS